MTTSITIGDLVANGFASIQTGPFGSQLHSYDYKTSGVKVVPTEAIDGGRLKQDVMPCISIEKAAELSRHTLWRNDILFARRGVQATGKTALVGGRDEGAICGTGAIRLRIAKDNSVVDPQYLAKALLGPEARSWLREQAIGATMPNLNEGIIKLLSVRLPPLPEQRRIASLLGALDDKIELNRRMNATLEEMARALFRSWFVDFDPVHARAAGEPPAHMQPETAALFPDRFGDDGLPEGWRIAKLGEQCSVKGGKQLAKTEISVDAPNPVFGGAGLMGRSAKYNADGHVITVGRVGAYCGGFSSHKGRAWVNNNASQIVPDRQELSDFTLHLLYSLDLSAIRKGAAQPFISNGDLSALSAIVPPHAIQSEFCSAFSPIGKRQEILAAESRTLAALRDALLPPLMSGELRVRDAETLVEEVA